MENNTSNNSAKLNFGLSDRSKASSDNKITTFGGSPVKESVDEKPEPIPGSVEEKDINVRNREYIDKRSVTIALVKNYSLFRRANDKSLTKRRDFIGSSVTSSRTLSSNKGEVEAYFPDLIGLSPNNENFITRVKQYLNNIQISVNELGKKFDISFRYDRYIDFRAIQDKEKLIEEKYRQANKSNLGELKKALAAKIAAINDLESSKYQFGRPVNIEDYLIYRHCLLYKDIAKDTALINSDPSIRFYFKDDQKEADLQRKLRLENNKAKANFVSMIADDELFDAIYAQYCVNVGKPVILSSLEDRMIKENELDKFSSDEPIKFNKMFNDTDIKIKATIEILIERGEFVRSQYNQNIITPEGEFIGANVKEAVAWFKNPANADVVNAYKNKLKNV